MSHPRGGVRPAGGGGAVRCAPWLGFGAFATGPGNNRASGTGRARRPVPAGGDRLGKGRLDFCSPGVQVTPLPARRALGGSWERPQVR